MACLVFLPSLALLLPCAHTSDVMNAGDDLLI